MCVCVCVSERRTDRRGGGGGGGGGKKRYVTEMRGGRETGGVAERTRKPYFTRLVV